MDVKEYIAAIGRKYMQGNATEHSYRGALQRLLSDLMPGLTVLNEPRRIACGAPDYIIARAAPSPPTICYTISASSSPCSARTRWWRNWELRITGGTSQNA